LRGTFKSLETFPPAGAELSRAWKPSRPQVWSFQEPENLPAWRRGAFKSLETFPPAGAELSRAWKYSRPLDLLILYIIPQYYSINILYSRFMNGQPVRKILL
jgi:hypothetical protein